MKQARLRAAYESEIAKKKLIILFLVMCALLQLEEFIASFLMEGKDVATLLQAFHITLALSLFYLAIETNSRHRRIQKILNVSTEDLPTMYFAHLATKPESIARFVIYLPFVIICALNVFSDAWQSATFENRITFKTFFTLGFGVFFASNLRLTYFQLLDKYFYDPSAEKNSQQAS